MSRSEPSCRIYCILARDGRSAVVFRRGPSRNVLLLKWNLRRDTLEEGQWLKGRIYERRGDLSPDGELLVYFAAKTYTTANGALGTWTAVSRPPYLTALALWPKGDAWGGGGHFFDGRRLGINHPDWQMAPMCGLAPPRNLTVSRVAPWAGSGEDWPIEAFRMERDGWTFSRDHKERMVARRPSPREPKLVLERTLAGFAEQGRPFYREDFLVIRGGEPLFELPDCTWADWSAKGDLLFANRGTIRRLPSARASKVLDDVLQHAKLVADLTDLRFTEVKASHDARIRI